MRGLVRFARESLGVEFYPGQVEVLDQWAGSGRRKAVLALGRRSGKGLMGAVAAIHNATVPDYRADLRPGEQRYIIVVATRLDQAREFIRTVRELLDDAPDDDLRALVDESRSTLDEVVFNTPSGQVVIRSMPCSARSTRGLAASLVILDEAAHMNTTEDGYAAGKRIYQALVPSTAQFGGRGYVMVLSSPLWSSGIFWELYQAGVTGVDGDVFVARKPTWEMNATITRESLAGEFLSDPDSARVEYGAEFSEGAGAFLQAVNIQECVIVGRGTLPPLPDRAYMASMDPAFAAGGDAFTLCIAHVEQDAGERIHVVDLLEAWRGRDAPLNSDSVLDDIKGLLRSYRINGIASDQYAAVPLTDALRRRGIEVRAKALTNELKGDYFATLKRQINTARIELPDDQQLIAELINLEIRPTPSGKPRIAAAGSGHDDRAMAVATVVYALEEFGWVIPAETEMLATFRRV